MSDNPTQQFPAPQGDPQQTPMTSWAPPAGPTPPGPKEPMSKGKKVLIGAGVILGLGILGNLVGGDPATTPTAAADKPAATSSSSTPSVDPSKAAAEAAAKASAEKAAEKAAADAAAKAEAEAKAAEKAAADAAAKAEKARLDKSSYSKISGRSFAKVAKDADSYVGKKYVIYGYVTQFDSATGPDTFRANADGVRHGEWYDYDANVIVTASDPSILEDVVEDDLVTMYVEVAGSIDYDTQIGGSTTAPVFNLNVIKVTGSTN